MEQIKMLKFTVPGQPAGKARAKVTKRVSYTPQKTVNYEAHIKKCFRDKYGEDFIPLKTPVFMYVNMYYKIPMSASLKKKQLMLDGIIRPTVKPDKSNVLKAVEDALNTIAYLDDNQIVDGEQHKYYSYRPRVDVFISEVK